MAALQSHIAWRLLRREVYTEPVKVLLAMTFE